MKWFSNLTIKTKLITMAGFLSFMLLLAGGMGFIGVHQSKLAISHVYNEHVAAINDLNEVRSYQYKLLMELLAAQQETDAFEVQAYNDRVDKFIYEISKILNNYQARAADPDEKKLLGDFLAARKEFGLRGVEPMKDLLIAEKHQESIQHYRTVLVPTFSSASYALDSLIKFHVANTRFAYEKISRLALATEWTAGITTLVGLTLSLLLSLTVSLSISRCVATLRMAVNKAAKGDLTVKSGLNNKDEVGVVAQAFDEMVAAFKIIIGQVHSSAGLVTNESTQLAAAADAVASSSDAQIEQSNAASGSAKSLDESMRSVAARIIQVTEATDQAGQQAAKGQQVVNEAVKGIENVARTVEESARMIASLGHRSDEIGHIVQVIKDIADQTNLLALNAAIEAARAGEQGRGFAVVADEVRKLAERTTQATSEISNMFQAIQGETGQTIQIMERGNRQVADGVNQAKQAGMALDAINLSVTQVLTLIREINSVSQSQASAADDISHRIENIARSAQANGKSIVHVVSAAQELRTLSGNLDASVSRFTM